MADFVGGGGDDIFTGGSDNDTGTGNGGNDQLSGGDGSDNLSGDDGADTLDGGAGSDYLFSATRVPNFFGGSFNYSSPPILDSGNAVDTLNGGGGDDFIFAGYGDNVDGGGNDFRGDYLHISFEGAPSGITVSFANLSAGIVVGGATIINIEHISWVDGSNFDDDITVGDIGNGYANSTTVRGLGGNDRLIASYYTAVLDGGTGNDFIDLRPSQYAQAAYGGSGDDVIYTPSNSFGNSYGDDGNDTIYAGAGTNYGGNGNDIIHVNSSYYFSAALGEAGDDTLNGNVGGFISNGEVLIGGDGADIISGYGGSDTLVSGNRDAVSLQILADAGLEYDQLFGGDGDDTLYAGYGDAVDGGAGTDTLHLSFGGASSGVTFNTGPLATGGSVTIAGGLIQNVERTLSLTGSAFGDNFTIATQSNALTVSTGDGDDLVQSDLSSITLNTGNGNDRFISGRAADTFNGGAGIDTVDYQLAISGITVALSLTAGGTGTGGGSDSLINVENIDGSNFNDTVDGNNDANVINGRDGDDTLRSYGGDDILIGGAGADSLIGGVGNDSYFVDAGDTITELNGGGNDRVYAAAAYSLGAGVYVETLSTTDDNGTTAINLFGNELANSVIGNAGDNTLYGFDGDDVLTGGAGNDIMAGGAGNDTMNGGSGGNQYIGGTGNDIYVVTAATTGEAVLNTLFEAAGEGTDEVRVTSSVFSLEWFGSSELERLTLTDGGSHAAAIGNALNNVITGNLGADDLFGRAGNDTLSGGSGAANSMFGQEGDDLYIVSAVGDSVIEFTGEGNDTVQALISSFTLGANVENLTFTGSNTTRVGVGNNLANVIRSLGGDDSLNGGDGDDTLYAGSGADILQGGNGADQFRYEGGETGMDRILDFVSGTDKIALRSAFFTPTGTVDFVSGGSVVATSVNSTILYDTNTGIVWYDDDGTGAGAAVAIAQLNAGQTFTAGDFLFY